MSQLREQDLKLVPRIMRWVLQRACQIVSDDCPISVPSPDVTQVKLGDVSSRDTLYEGFLGLHDIQEAFTAGKAVEDSVIAGDAPNTERQESASPETTNSPQAAAVPGSVSGPPNHGHPKRWISPLQLTASPKSASTHAESISSPSSTTFSTKTNPSSRSSTPSQSDRFFKFGEDCFQSESKFEASNTYKSMPDEIIQELQSLLKAQELSHHVDLNNLRANHAADKVRSEDHHIAKIDKLRLQIQSQKQSMDEKDAVIAQISTELTQKDNGLTNAKEKLQVAEDLTQITTAGNVALVQKLEECEEQLGETEFLLNKSWHQYSGAREQFASCALEKAQLTAEVDELKEKLMEAKEDAARRKRTLKSTASELQRLTRLLEARDGIAELEAENAGLLVQIEGMVKERSTLYTIGKTYFQQREAMVLAANQRIQEELVKRWNLQQWATSEIYNLQAKQEELEKALADEKLKSKISPSFESRSTGRKNTNLFNNRLSEQSLSNADVESWKREKFSTPSSPEQPTTFPTHRRRVPDTNAKPKQGPFDLNRLPTEDLFMKRFGPQDQESQEPATQQAQQSVEAEDKHNSSARTSSPYADRVTDHSKNQYHWSKNQPRHQGHQASYQSPWSQTQPGNQGREDTYPPHSQGSFDNPYPAGTGPFDQQSKPQHPQPQRDPFHQPPPNVTPNTQTELDQENFTGEATHPPPTPSTSWPANNIPSNPWNKDTTPSQPVQAQDTTSPNIWNQTPSKTQPEPHTQANTPHNDASEQDKPRTTAFSGPLKDKKTKNKQRAALRKAAKARAYRSQAAFDSDEMEQ